MNYVCLDNLLALMGEVIKMHLDFCETLSYNKDVLSQRAYDVLTSQWRYF